ncbi:MAG: hypothetical protein ACRC9L_04815 [Brevinema sp.]
MNSEEKKAFFDFWSAKWEISQLKQAYEALLQDRIQGMADLFIGELSRRGETLSREECITYAVLHSNMGETEIFVSYIKIALRQHPQDMDLNFGLAQYYVETENYKELNRLLLNMEKFISNHPHLYFLKGLCVLKLLEDFSTTRALWKQACMAGSDAACDGLKQLDQIEMITKLDQQEAYKREVLAREQRLKSELQESRKGSYSNQDFLKDMGGTAARAAMFSIVGGLVSSMLFGRGGNNA